MEGAWGSAGTDRREERVHTHWRPGLAQVSWKGRREQSYNPETPSTAGGSGLQSAFNA